MSRRTDVRRFAALGLGAGGVVTLGLAAWLGFSMPDVPAMQRVGAALVPTLVGTLALWGARRVWRTADPTP